MHERAIRATICGVNAASTALDRLDIIELIHRYAAVIDLKRYDDVPSVFADDAVCNYESMRAWVGDDFEPRGAADIRRWLEQYTGHRQSMHLMHNHVVELRGDEATMRCYMHNTNSSIVGIYYLEARREPAGWRLTRLQLDERFVEPHRVAPNP